MAKQKFYIPICVDNLAQFFAFGFITPASVFPFNTYEPDELSLHLNVIPLHKKPSAKAKIPFDGVQLSKTEDENLKSAVVAVSIDDAELEQLDSSPWVYLSGILPTYLINEITFEDKSARDHFDYLTRQSGRVSQDLLDGVDFKITGFEKLFQQVGTDELTIDDVPDYEISVQPLTLDQKALRKMSGYGAVLALSYVMAKNSDLVNCAFKELSSIDNQSDDALLAVKLITSYLFRDLEEEPSKHRIQDEYFDVLINCGSQEKIVDRLVPFFDMEMGDINASAFLQDLKTRVSDILKGKVVSTKSEQMTEFSDVKRVSQFINQTVTMFALLDDSEKLFTQPISTISGEGYLNIAIAYGLRDKFYELPRDVRQIKGLEPFIIERMYEYYLKISEKKRLERKSQFGYMPTLIDIMSDSDTPDINNAIFQKFGLVSKNLQQTVLIGGYSYVPECPEKMIEALSPESDEFASKMVTQKAFDDVDFNTILDLYDLEKSLAKARKKYEKRLKQL